MAFLLKRRPGHSKKTVLSRPKRDVWSAYYLIYGSIMKTSTSYMTPEHDKLVAEKRCDMSLRLQGDKEKHTFSINENTYFHFSVIHI
jgi:hypothetical protein